MTDYLDLVGADLDAAARRLAAERPAPAPVGSGRRATAGRDGSAARRRPRLRVAALLPAFVLALFAAAGLAVLASRDGTSSELAVQPPVAPSRGAPPPELAGVPVVIANGTAVNGLATNLAQKLETAGWNVEGVVNAPDQTAIGATTVVYAAFAARRGRAMARALGVPARAAFGNGPSLAALGSERAEAGLDLGSAGLALLLRADAQETLSIARPRDSAVIPVHAAVARVRRNVDVPVEVPAGLPPGTRALRTGDRGTLRLRFPDSRVLSLTYGRADFDGCGPAEPQSVSINGRPGIASGVTIVWPAASPDDLPGTYAITGQFPRRELLAFARSMDRATAPPVSSPRRGC